MKRRTKANLALVFTTFIWGATFVPVQNAINTIPPFIFNAIRFLIGFAVLTLIYHSKFKNIGKKTLLHGSVIGLALFAGYAFQTLGLQYTRASSSAFITSLCVIFVPIMWSMKTKKLPNIWAILGIILATVGLALMTLDSSLSINIGDVLSLLCSICFALSIILIDIFTSTGDPTSLVLVEIGTVSVLGFFMSFVLRERWTFAEQFTKEVIYALLVTGVFATALAILIQNKAQKLTSPTHVALIFSAEPVFAAITSYILLGEKMTPKNIWGGLLILLAVIITDIEPHKLKGTIFAPAINCRKGENRSKL